MDLKIPAACILSLHVHTCREICLLIHNVPLPDPGNDDQGFVQVHSLYIKTILAQRYQEVWYACDNFPVPGSPIQL